MQNQGLRSGEMEFQSSFTDVAMEMHIDRGKFPQLLYLL